MVITVDVEITVIISIIVVAIMTKMVWIWMFIILEYLRLKSNMLLRILFVTQITRKIVLLRLRFII